MGLMFQKLSSVTPKAQVSTEKLAPSSVPIPITLSLSDAIRLGATLKRQGFGSLHHGGRTCATGAAEDAAGLSGSDGSSFMYYWPAHWLAVIETHGDCPACSEPQSWVLGVITHLNDDHRWSRERIADWVQTVEAGL